jgi:predicted O-linked N-acetylglucosamine transferase (SPINDLY family)
MTSDADPLALLEQAVRLHQAGDAVGALGLYDRVIEIDPANASAHNNRAAALAGLGRYADAADGYATVAALLPDYAGAPLYRGNALLNLGLQADAIASYDQALQIDPANADAHNNRGNALRELDRLEEAVEAYGAALAIRPDYRGAAGMRQHLKMHRSDWSGFDGAVAQIGALIEQGVPATTPLPLIALTDDPVLHRRCAQLHVAGYPRAAPAFEAPRPDGERIRLCYVSRDFQAHPVAQLIAEVFERHDRSRFELIAFSFGPDTDDPWRRRTAAAFDRFIDIRGMSDAQAAALAREMGVDIAVDLAGFTQRTRTPIFAHGAAPVQVNYLGYPGTLGTDFIDYVVGDRVTTPAGSEAFYSEQVVRLPGAYQANRGYAAPAGPPPSRDAHGLPKDAVVYACFNSGYKITPPVFDRWMNILGQVDNSVLWLLVGHPAARANLLGEAARRGIDPARIVFAGNLPFEAHLDRLRLADLFLDTFPYNAHTTASDALRMGLPLLTCPGRSFASRVGASLVTAAGLAELIADSFDDYERLAIGLGRDPNRLRAVRAKLAANLPACALFDAAQFTKNLESAYERMHARRRAGLPPNGFDV